MPEGIQISETTKATASAPAIPWKTVRGLFHASCVCHQPVESFLFDRLPRLMPDVFWIGFGIAAFCVLVGLIAGARSTTTRTLTGVAIGAYLGLMAGFPLLAIGLATS